MQRPQIPPYKPPAQLQDLIQQQQQQNQQRKRTAVLPKRTWIQRNPRLFQISFLTVSLLALFSKPIYDGFFAEATPAIPGKTIPPHKR